MKLTIPRKEFFNLTIDEIVEAVKEKHGEIEFTKIAEAKQYRVTLAKKKKLSNIGNITEEDQFPVNLF